jgi:hypothetical protein
MECPVINSDEPTDGSNACGVLFCAWNVQPGSNRVQVLHGVGTHVAGQHINADEC